MASNVSVIREFLVALGFKTDETALRNFQTGISKATKSALALGAAVEAMATTIAVGLQRFSSNLEQLYFASIRTGSAVTNLMAFDRTMQNFGASAGEGLAAVEGLSHALRVQPGNEGLLESLIGPLKRLKDGTIDAQDALLRLAKPLSQQPIYLAEQYANMLGIPEKVLLGMRNGDFLKEFARIRSEVSKQGLDKAAEDAHKFNVEIRDLTILLEQFGLRVYEALVRRLGGSLGDLSAWLQKNGPMLADQVASVLLKIIDIATTVSKAIGWLIDKFVEWDKATNGWSTKLLGILLVLKLFGGVEIITGVLKLAGAFLSLGKGIAGVATIAGTLSTLLGASGILDLVKAIFGVGPGGAGTALFNSMSLNTQDAIGSFIAKLGAISGFKGAQESLANADPLQYLMLGGHYTKAQAAGLLANFKAESGLNPTAENKGHYGIAQWDESRQAQFKQVMGKDIHGSTLSEQMNFALYELMQGQEQAAGKLLRAQQNAEGAARVVSNSYERHGRGEKEDQRREQLAAKIDQETNIYVTGTDPRATAKQVEDHQNRVNARLASNLTPVVR